MADADRERWDARHAAVVAADAGAPAPPDALRGRTGLLPPGGRALDVACGRGTVAVWLAARGFAVDAVDVSPVALDAGRELAAREGVTVRWVLHDLDAGLPVAEPDDCGPTTWSSASASATRPGTRSWPPGSRREGCSS